MHSVFPTYWFYEWLVFFFLLTLCNHLEVHYKKLLSPLEIKLTLEAAAIATG